MSSDCALNPRLYVFFAVGSFLYEEFTVPTLTIHDLSEEAMYRLRKRAQQNNRSREEEARDILERHFATKIGILSELRELWTDIALPSFAQDIEDWSRNPHKTEA